MFTMIIYFYLLIYDIFVLILIVKGTIMKLIFVRHGEPDYINDSLTENGRAEALALAKRISTWDVTEFYVSPQGRARETAAPSLAAVNREAITLDYMREFSYPIDDPITGRHGVPWDFIPSYWTNIPGCLKEGDGFLESELIASNPNIIKNYPIVINGFDKLLEEYGYTRKDHYYINNNPVNRRLKSTVGPDDKIRNNGLYPNGGEPTLVIFCHLGVTCLVLSHLLNIPFECLTHGFFMPPTSITVLSTEERWDNEAYFRVQCIGDVTHLHDAGLPISYAGSFADMFTK